MILQIIALLLAFTLTAVSGTFVLKFLKKEKLRQDEREDGPESHLKKKGTPSMGSLMFIPAICVIGLVVGFVYTEIIPVVIFTFAMFGVGLLDDYIKIKKDKKGLSAKSKSVLQLIVSAIYVGSVLLSNGDNHFIINTLFAVFSIPVWLYAVLALLFIYVMTNAVNLTDGVDGLDGTIVSIVMITLSVIFLHLINLPGEAAFAASIAGGCIGFLIYNRYPAKVFMGDSGSLALGAAFSALMLKTSNPFLVVLIGFIFCIEAFSVILQVGYYKKTKKRIFLMAPIHHHFEKKGWSEKKVVAVFSSVTIVGSALTLLLLIFCGAKI